MKRTEMSKLICQNLVCLCIALAATSCSNGNEADVESSNVIVGRECYTNAVVAVDVPKEQSMETKVALEFKRIIRDAQARERDIGKMNQIISQLPNQQESLRLYNELLEMAIAQQICTTNYNQRSAQYYKLWFIALYSFLGAQRRQDGDFAYWDKMFGLFAKYTDEITSVEKTLPTTDSKYWSWKDIKKGTYLCGIRGDFKTWVHVMRDFYFPELSKGLTDEQKADILRRFDELKKYTIQPPNFPGGKK